MKWQEVTPEEIAMAEPKIDPDAGAEILIREMEVDDQLRTEVVRRNYMRFKVFDQRGVDRLNPMKIEVERKVKVYGVAARVIKPDGSILVVEKSDIFSRETSRDDDERWRTVSFSFPGIEPGCIVEYQWDEIETGRNASGMFFRFASRYPTHLARFRIRPFITYNWTGNMLQGERLEKGGAGYREVVLRDLPALPDEPFMPPRFDYQPWVSLYYTGDRRYGKPDVFWGEVADWLHDHQRQRFKSRRSEIREKAAELTAGANTPQEKIQRIYDFCTYQIRNTRISLPDGSFHDIPKDLDNADAPATLKAGVGTPDDIAILFGSLLEAAGLHVSLALCNDRSLLSFYVESLVPQSLPDLMVAVRIDDSRWVYCNPGVPFVPNGMLHWSNENGVALLAGEKEPRFLKLGASPAGDTQIKRRAIVSIDEEGKLSGTVTFSYTGHAAIRQRDIYNGVTPVKREEDMLEKTREMLPNAQITELQFKNLVDCNLPLEVSFEIEVPAYADVAVQRIFIQPSFFEKGAEPVLRKEKREHAIQFPCAWEMQDEVRITYPDGYEVEEGRTPVSVANDEYLTHQVVFGKVKDRNMLIYRRQQAIKFLNVGAEGYEPIKNYFDLVYEQDQHVVTLRPKQPDPLAAAE
ncbi:MAG: DUF3857 and transglutaminase domain-containing protein [Verrucomicrobiota bacterium JB022]|nr:DUF3857 and transglutaminase domain-containing protein [Verrucomicrobiota bacterium JB022]